MADMEKIIEDLSALTVVEAADLVKQLEEKWGVEAAKGGGMMMAMPTEAAAEEVQTEFDVELTSFGSSKIKVIKEVRSITGLGLKEAKALVDSAPKVIKEACEKGEAEKIKESLEGAGATVTIK